MLHAPVSILKRKAYHFVLAFTLLCATALGGMLVSSECAWAASGLSVSGSNTVYESTDGLVAVYGKTAGTISYDTASKTLTLNGVKAEALAAKSGTVNINLIGANTMEIPGYWGYKNASGSYVSGNAAANLVLKGSGSFTGAINLRTAGLTVASGAVTAVSKSSYTAGIQCGAFRITGGSFNGNISCKSFGMSGGSISKTGGEIPVVEVEDGAFTMSGGTFNANSAYQGVRLWTSKNVQRLMSITGGTFNCISPKNCGISLSKANLGISGGTVNITNSQRSAISTYSTQFGSAKLGGKVAVTGGALNVGTYTPKSYAAIEADAMSNKLGTLKSVKGGLPVGATFKVSGNTYKINKAYSTSGYVTLLKYESKKTKASFNAIKFGSVSYKVNAVGSKAFNTKQGKKVKSIVFKQELTSIAANAFYNTKSLTSLKLAGSYYKHNFNKKYTKLKSISLYSGTKYNKKAFKGAGKNKGKNLTIVVGKKGVPREYSAAYKKFFKSKGMSKNTKIKTY